MNGRLNEYLVSTNSVPTRRPATHRTTHLPARRLRMSTWARRIGLS